MMRSRLAAVAAAVAGFYVMSASAAPITYTFTTGPQLTGVQNPPETRGFFSGVVSGTFVYDADAPLTTTFSSPATDIDLGHLYAGALLNISGSVDGRTFSDSAGAGASLSNDTYTPPPTQAGRDLLTLGADPLFISSGAPRNLLGFDIGGWTLVNVRLFWIEGLIGGAPDFLNDVNLPGELPSATGRLALDFVRTGFVPGEVPQLPQTFAFFDGLVVRPVPASVPEPGSLLLFAAGVAVMLGARGRRHRARV